MSVFFEIFSALPRCGPGDNASTRKAYATLTALPPHPAILDIGCGPGMQTIELARLSDGHIVAVDTHQPYLDQLRANAIDTGLGERITTLDRSMFELEIGAESFDLVWAEGAVYIIGFQRGLREWKRLLKPGGYLAVSEAVWLRPPESGPPAVRTLWEEYPQIAVVDAKCKIIADTGYLLVSHFILPEASWWDHYYRPLEARLVGLWRKYRDDPAALDMIEATQHEIDIYREHSAYYGYAFFTMRKPSPRGAMGRGTERARGTDRP